VARVSLGWRQQNPEAPGRSDFGSTLQHLHNLMRTLHRHEREEFLQTHNFVAKFGASRHGGAAMHQNVEALVEKSVSGTMSELTIFC
jgi:hypothetical protein